MSLVYCTECKTLEGRWRAATAEEQLEYGISADQTLCDDFVCLECGAKGGPLSVPEHDDYDMER